MDDSKYIAYVTCHNCKEKEDCSGGRQIDCFADCIDWMKKQKAEAESPDRNEKPTSDREVIRN